MIHVSETFALHTTEEFLTEEESTLLEKVMTSDPPETDGGAEPSSRYERAPAAAQSVLQQAFERALPSLKRVMPAVAAAAPWSYAEIVAGDSVPVHVDGIPDPLAHPKRIGRIGVVITAAQQGGEFYVATTASPELWTDTELGETDGFHRGMRLTRSLPHEVDPSPQIHASPTWAQSLPQTRWTTDAPARTAVAYGAQLMHGVTPVTSGVVRKFVTDLLAAPSP
ncbi:hypothetical protein [Streptomyces luteolus]|uniref:Fe2OG dioxygenase domain-containing protein n=1 Tax=Streptomyces luteolus TaxID=3043615 RepID=A0ABT6SQI8_9ACTN|nr:hypothetical protein [Streptomyces sp. B-S-A12]MDI3417620.1 hypothetical protein [Streptomyces sp. B-S-A12]